MNFDFFMPTELITGPGCVAENSHRLAELGEHCLLVTSGAAAQKSGALDDAIAALQKEKIRYTIHNTVEQNPLLSDAYAAGETAKEVGADFIFGIGGGSALDAAKVVAVYAANTMKPMDIYDRAWSNPALPIVAIGTTAGTGSEVTMVSVMTQEDGVKQSITHPDCYPIISFGDATYTHSLPISFTFSTAIDALSHALEGYFATSANAISDMFALEAIDVLYHTLSAMEPTLTEASQVTPKEREQLYYGSIAAGMTLSHTGTCYCHSLGYFLSEEHGIPHGVACGIYLGGFVRRQAGYLPEKAQRLWKRMGATEDQLVALIESFLPTLTLTLSATQIEKLVDRYVTSNNFKRTAPAGLPREEALQIVTSIFGK